MKLADFLDAEAGMARSAGHCMTMGTASTMASMVEALGIGMPGNAAIPGWIRGERCWRSSPDGASSKWYETM